MSLTMRLAKFIPLTGLCSRRAATRYIRDGLITIDGRQANHTDTVNVIEKATGGHCVEKLQYDGRDIGEIQPKQYWLFHKAVGTDSRLLANLPNSLIHLLPTTPRLYPVGRLDKDSRGLLLLTNDGELTQQLMHPQFGHTKAYDVQVDRPYPDRFLAQMAKGVSYKGITTLPCQMKRLSQDRFEIVLTQGLNRQIRRMSQALGFNVVDLKRTKIQGLELGELVEGEMRQLTDTEVDRLKLDSTPKR